MTDYSREALLEFLEYAGDKGLLNKNTAAARRAAASNMLSILDDAEAVDMRRLDIDSLTSRFANIYARKYTPESLRVYRSRLKSSVDEFIRYVENPAGFKMQPTPKPQKKQLQGKVQTLHPTSLPAVVAADERPGAANSIRTIDVPIPLRGSCIVMVNGLPADLTGPEAQRIANVILAFATPGSA